MPPFSSSRHPPPHLQPQILPLDGLNITQMNIRESVTAASAAACLPAERAVPASGSSPGLSLMRSRGGGATQILAAGGEGGLRSGVAGLGGANGSWLGWW